MQCKKYIIADRKSGGIGSKIKGAGAATMTLLSKLGTKVKKTSPRKVVPILDWGLRYDFKGALLGDCIAGVTVAIMQVRNITKSNLLNFFLVIPRKSQPFLLFLRLTRLTLSHFLWI